MRPDTVKRLVVGFVAVVMASTGVLAPAGPGAQAAAGPQQVLGFVNVVSALFHRNRVYRNAGEVQDELRVYYARLEAAANEALLDREVLSSGSQAAAYIRLRASIAVERDAALQLLEDDKRGERRTFRSTVNRELPSMLLTIPAARDMAQVLRGDLGELRDVLTNARAAIAEGRPDALLDIPRRRAGLDRLAAAVEAVGGEPGRRLAAAIGSLGAELQRIERASDAVTDDVDTGIDQAGQQLDAALSQLDAQLAAEVRPVSVSVAGGLGTVRIPGRFAFYAALADALSGPGGRRHGLSRDAMRDRVRQYLIETQGAELAEICDCFRATAAQLRARLAGEDAPEGSAAALLLGADLSTCDPDAVIAVIAAAAELAAATTTTTTTTTDGPTGTTGPAEPTATTAPAQPAGTISGGGVHTITTDSPGITIGNAGRLCLEYRENRPDELALILVACTTSPRFEVEYDLAAGTVAGSIELDLQCPGVDRCGQDVTATGSVRGSFGPFPFGQQPAQPPADFPFPAHHYYPDADDWWAGGPIELAVSISGERVAGDVTVSGSASTTITGWVSTTLWAPRRVPGELPESWVADFAVDLDYPQETDPNWYLYAGFSAPVPESGIDVAPWDR